MSYKTQRPNLNLEKLAELYATKIANYCLDPSLEIPLELFNYSPGVTILSYQRMQLYSVKMLGLDSISENSYEEYFSIIKNALLNVMSWTFEGAFLMQEQSKDFAQYYSNRSLLELFSNKNQDTPYVSENINMAYYLLCLNELADFQSNYTKSFGELVELENGNELHKKSIDCLGSLICAHEAFEAAQSNTWRIAGEQGVEKVQQMYKKQAEHQNELQRLNKERQVKSQEFWEPKIHEVLNLMSEKKEFSISSACSVVANRYQNVNSQTLRNKVTLHNKNLNKP